MQYGRVSAVTERLKLPWCKLANVTTDGLPNLTVKNIRLLKRIMRIRIRWKILQLHMREGTWLSLIHQILWRNWCWDWLTVLWLSMWGWELKREMSSLVELMGKAVNFPELSDTDWLCDRVYCGHIGTCEWSEHEATRKRSICAQNVYKCKSLLSQNDYS